MKRVERICRMMQILRDHPHVLFSLGDFAQRFDCTKSAISQDVKVMREALEDVGSGRLLTVKGARGGIRYLPQVSREQTEAALEALSLRLLEEDRMLGGGFLYTSDLMYDPATAKPLAQLFAQAFSQARASCVVTVETKGIALAAFTAACLNLPLIVMRRESKVSEGSMISINYFSGSADRIQKMSLAKRALQPGARALIVDDFMRGGGSIRGILDMLEEFGAEAVGTGVVMAVRGGLQQKIGPIYPLLLLDMDPEDGRVLQVSPGRLYEDGSQMKD